MSHSVVFEPTASLELNEAANFYDLERPGLGTEFLDAVEAALIVVADTPAALPIELGETRKRSSVDSHTPSCTGSMTLPCTFQPSRITGSDPDTGGDRP